MGNELAALLLFSFFYVRVSYAAPHNMSNTDISSLLSLKSGFNSNILATNWAQETSLSSWIGFSCGRRHLRVTGLDLSGMGLRGTIAREIGNLSFLTFLSISNNNINGVIPEDIGNLRWLRVLNMSWNQLSNHIPESIGLLRKLKSISLSNNYLSGDIPARVSACVELNILDLSYNNFTGNISRKFWEPDTRFNDSV